MADSRRNGGATRRGGRRSRWTAGAGLAAVVWVATMGAAEAQCRRCTTPPAWPTWPSAGTVSTAGAAWPWFPPTGAPPVTPTTAPPPATTTTTTPPAPAAAPAPPPPAAPTPVPAAAGRLLDLVNQERAKAGLAPLVQRDDVAAIALAHSRRMAQAGDIFHNTGYYDAATKRLLGAGVRGENVAYNSSVDNTHARLMISPGHRANILDARFTVAGFAVVRAPDGRYFTTQDFLRPAGAPQPAAAAAAPRAAPAPRSTAATPRSPAPATATPVRGAPAPPAPASPAQPPASVLSAQEPIVAGGPPAGPGVAGGPAALAVLALLAVTGAAGWAGLRHLVG